MTRCNSFCLTLDEAAAARAARKIDRFSSGVAAIGGLGTKGNWSALGLVIDGEGLPISHGLRDLESTTLESGPEGISASRDFPGTRPLFVAESGRWIASDHRYFRGEVMNLLPPGTRVGVGGRGVSEKRMEPVVLERTMDEAADELAGLIRASVKARVAGRKKVAVAFSGGLDSSVIARCAAANVGVIACSVSAEGSLDDRAARRAAEVLDIDYAQAVVERTEVGDEVRHMDLPFEPTEMDRALWCIYSKASRLASENGADMIMLGQLADELFGGYAKYERKLIEEGGGEAAKVMREDVSQCGVRGFVRDELACSRWVEPSFPFADRNIIEFGFSLPMRLKISGGLRKAVLRRAARILGLPEEIAMRQKKAAQYSSGILKLL